MSNLTVPAAHNDLGINAKPTAARRRTGRQRSSFARGLLLAAPVSVALWAFLLQAALQVLG